VSLPRWIAESLLGVLPDPKCSAEPGLIDVGDEVGVDAVRNPVFQCWDLPFPRCEACRTDRPTLR
jgi:hypothetical protein